MTLKNLKILVPTDFSERSYKAFRPASYLAGLFGGKIDVMTRYEPEEKASFPAPPPKSKDKDEVKQELMDLAKKYVDDESHLNKAIVRSGKAAHKLIAEESGNYDLVVMATHGRSGFSRLLLGSVTEKVLRFSKVPVLAVENEGIRPLKNILVTTDFSDYSAEAFPYVKELAKASGAQVDLLNVAVKDQFTKDSDFESQRKKRKELLEELIDKNFSDIKDQMRGQMIAAETSIHEAITRRVNEGDYNLVVMSTLGRTRLDYLRLGSTASNVSRHVKTAVLSINPKRNENYEEEV